MNSFEARLSSLEKDFEELKRILLDLCESLKKINED